MMIVRKKQAYKITVLIDFVYFISIYSFINMPVIFRDTHNIDLTLYIFFDDELTLSISSVLTFL